MTIDKLGINKIMIKSNITNVWRHSNEIICP